MTAVSSFICERWGLQNTVTYNEFANIKTKEYCKLKDRFLENVLVGDIADKRPHALGSRYQAA